MVVVLLVERLEMLTHLHVQLKVVVLVVLLVELLVEPLEMLVQLHVHLKVLVLVVLLPRAAGNAGAPVLVSIVQTQLKQPPLLAATRPAAPVAWWNVLPAAPGASLQAGWCPI